MITFRLWATPGAISYSSPLYRSSVFSRKMIKSMGLCWKEMPSAERTGRTLAYKSSARRSCTFTDWNPSPIGVVIGPFKATLFFRIDSNVSSGRTEPYF